MKPGEFLAGQDSLGEVMKVVRICREYIIMVSRDQMKASSYNTQGDNAD